MTKEGLVCRLVGLGSGLLFAIPNMYPVLAPLQLVGLVPILYLGASGKVRSRYMLSAGMYMGLAYSLAQLIALRLPVAVTIILIVDLTILLTVFVWGSARLLRGPAISGAFAVGALLVVLDWLNFTAVGFWGTAQSLVRCWSWYPNAILFASFTGITGVVFLLGALQALAVNFIVRPSQKTRLFAALTVLVLVFATANIIVRYKQPAERLKVAAIGWTSDDSAKWGQTYSKEGFDTLFAEPVARAAEQGARLIVSPEMGFFYAGGDLKGWLEQFRQVARKNKVFLVAGYFNNAELENRLFFMNSEGEVMGEYTKSCLTMFEKYNKGSGQLKTVDIEGIRVGGMICQDDNFTRFSREYGRSRIGVVAVPTLDWRQVKGVHFQNSIHRAIESRYAIVRAATDGISAIVSPTGEVLACRDHFADGSGVIAAQVPVYRDRTVFSVIGHWPAVLSLGFLVVYVRQNFLKNRRRPEKKPGEIQEK